jgi:hypothetical protein
MKTYDFIPATISHTLTTRILNLCLPAGRQGIRLPLPSVVQLRHSLQGERGRVRQGEEHG